MAAADPARRYWDSNCFLAWLMQEAERVDALRRGLDRAAGGRVQIGSRTPTQSEDLLLRGAPRVAG
ncbi:MAG: hypothetical protein OXC11_13045, partial [Rhodospirillales bacterium]|nr:hypothetical protein [Rhodospirillales bacterium]